MDCVLFCCISLHSSPIREVNHFLEATLETEINWLPCYPEAHIHLATMCAAVVPKALNFGGRQTWVPVAGNGFDRLKRQVISRGRRGGAFLASSCVT